ncbi:hypothetical protein AYI69_g10062, partial [Smittium culicis]
MNVLVPVGTQANQLLMAQITIPMPNVTRIIGQSDYVPNLYTDRNITNLGWTPDIMKGIVSGNFSSSIYCINCEEKNRAALNVKQLTKNGWC